jgi:DNA-binding NarL/FixJ family response regulator
VVQNFYRPESDESALDVLTTREREVLGLLAKGRIAKEIADLLSISRDTVNSHLKQIYQKMHVRSRTEAAIKYLQNNRPY